MSDPHGVDDHGHHPPPPPPPHLAAPEDEPPRWLDDPANVQKVIKTFFALCALVILIDLLGYIPTGDHHHLYDRHPHFKQEDGSAWDWWENVPFFYGVYGFVACVTLVEAAKLLRLVVMRPEDYYEPKPEQGEATQPAADPTGGQP